MKLYIISNRLPVKVTGGEGSLNFVRSEGGLATGLSSLQSPYEKHWIGWPGICIDDDESKKAIIAELKMMNFHPVFLSYIQVENYYEGYSNSTLWPLCHYFYAYTHYKKCFWKSYMEVNRLFCNAILRLIKPGDKVWVQDYQLMLLPGMLREAMPDLSIGYFHHIPFPSYELFRILPERGENIEGAARGRLHCLPYAGLYAAFRQCRPAYTAHRIRPGRSAVGQPHCQDRFSTYGNKL